MSHQFQLDVRGLVSPKYPEEPLIFMAHLYIGRVVYLDPRRVKPMKGQPREEFPGIDELAETLKTDGQQTSIVVHPIVDPDFDVELQGGERRTHASIRGGIMVRAEIRPVPADAKVHYVNAVVENFNRRDLTLLETVKMVARLIADGHNEKDIIRMTGKTKTWVSQYMTLGKMDLQALRLIGSEDPEQYSDDGRKLRRTTALPMSIALHIAKLPLDLQLPSTQEIVAQNMAIDQARDYVRKRLRSTGHGELRQRPPKEVFGVLMRETERTARLYERYLDMPERQFVSVLGSSESFRRVTLSGLFDDIVASLQMLKQTISSVTPVKNDSGWHPGILKWYEEQERSWHKSGQPLERWMSEQSVFDIPQSPSSN